GEASRYGPVFAGTYHLAAELWIHPSAEVVLLGPRDDPRVRALQDTARSTYAAGKTVLVVDRHDAYIPPAVEPMLKTKEAKAGPVVAEHLSASDSVAEVILADVDGELAKRTASRLKSPKAHATQLDASDAEGLQRTMRGCGLVINTALPQFNRTVQAAALAEG